MVLELGYSDGSTALSLWPWKQSQGHTDGIWCQSQLYCTTLKGKQVSLLSKSAKTDTNIVATQWHAAKYLWKRHLELRLLDVSQVFFFNKMTDIIWGQTNAPQQVLEKRASRGWGFVQSGISLNSTHMIPFQVRITKCTLINLHCVLCGTEIYAQGSLELGCCFPRRI